MQETIHTYLEKPIFVQEVLQASLIHHLRQKRQRCMLWVQECNSSDEMLLSKILCFPVDSKQLTYLESV